MLKLNCFKASDIRGKLGEELNEEIAWRIGRAFGEYLKAKTVVVGGDPRLTSAALKHAVSEGLRDTGVDVLDLGMCGTEEIYFATFWLDVDGGVEITASHNPADYNGMKLVRKYAHPVGAESGLSEVRRLAEAGGGRAIQAHERGQYQQLSLRDRYIDHLLSVVDIQTFPPLRVVINSGNGAAGPVVDALESRFQALNVPVELIKVHNTPDGNFPNGIPNPLLPECRKDTSDAVLKYRADLGIAFDGDFDRCFFFDNTGQFIDGYYIVGLLAEMFLQNSPGEKIVHDPRLTWNTIDLVNRAGGIPVMSRTGHAFVKARMREENAVYGGEMSAHHYFRDFAWCDSGMLPWLLIIGLLGTSGKSLRALVCERMNAFPVSGEINSFLSEPEAAIERVLSHFIADALIVDRTDGVSMEFIDWRFNLRVSGTESLVRLNVESRADPVLVENRTREILALLRQYA
ncbi:phosphomannomutase CpsG [Citrobacter amalonaticus]|uniref:phosphomannomutase CpsG n=1 Tax=Citrobacter amalonaticus TaxID=35703 RepID=UPI00300D3689